MYYDLPLPFVHPNMECPAREHDYCIRYCKPCLDISLVRTERMRVISRMSKEDRLRLALSSCGSKCIVCGDPTSQLVHYLCAWCNCTAKNFKIDLR